MPTKDDPIFRRCPVHNTPEFKTCQMCETCAILNDWYKEQKVSRLTCIKNNVKDIFSYLVGIFFPFKG